MNRAEKRRQQKLEKKQKRLASSSRNTKHINPATESILNRAVQQHNEGLLAEAEGLYRKALDANPNHHVALHLLGVLAQQTGHPDAAIELICKAISVKPD